MLLNGYMKLIKTIGLGKDHIQKKIKEFTPLTSQKVTLLYVEKITITSEGKFSTRKLTKSSEITDIYYPQTLTIQSNGFITDNESEGCGISFYVVNYMHRKKHYVLLYSSNKNDQVVFPPANSWESKIPLFKGDPMFNNFSLDKSLKDLRFNAVSIFQNNSFNELSGLFHNFDDTNENAALIFYYVAFKKQNEIEDILSCDFTCKKGNNIPIVLTLKLLNSDDSEISVSIE